MIFVDTSVWYAASVIEDPEHAIANDLLTKPTDRLVTTDYILDELLTLMSARGHRPTAKQVGRLLFAGTLCEIVWVNQTDIEAAWQVFDTFEDKAWSFTDCVSYVVMKRLDIKESFALDDHFRQCGFVQVLP